MKPLKSEIKKTAESLIESTIDYFFSQLHTDYDTSSGDISPLQQLQLDEALDKIVKVATDQVFQNIDFTKVNLQELDRNELLELAYTFDWNGSWEDDEEGQEPITKEELIDAIEKMIFEY